MPGRARICESACPDLQFAQRSSRVLSEGDDSSTSRSAMHVAIQLLTQAAKLPDFCREFGASLVLVVDPAWGTHGFRPGSIQQPGAANR